MSTQFTTITQAPPDPIFHLTASFKADTDPSKINLGVGAYRGDDGKPWVLPVVRKAEHLILENPTIDHEYLPIEGLKTFTTAAASLILGASSPAISENRTASIQTISGTGAVRMAAEFLSRFRKGPVYISKPTWANHRAIVSDAGLEVLDHPYWDPATKGLALEGMLAAMESAPNGSIFLLHACAHNPTGVDPTQDQWKQIADVMKSKGHFPFFDCAYQGFASGDLDKDAWAVRYFVEQGFELCIAQSFAKNFGLYGERCGAVTFVLESESVAKMAFSQLQKVQRAMISNPPAYGARIVDIILNSPELYNQWDAELKSMANRIILMRQSLFDALTELQTPGNWNHIIDQIGMFSFTGLSVAQCQTLKSKFHVYLTDNGRISMAGLNTSNVRRFAEAVDWVVRNVE